jgi:pimeloyl-ACP methyl ester carboxylesterase
MRDLFAAGRLCGARGLLGLAMLAPLEPARSQALEPQPAFSETACDLPNLSQPVRARLRCGTVSVPRNYGDQGAGIFKLAVVVVRSAEQPSLPDPVVYINGGPGSPLTIYADHQAQIPYAPRRDLILVDQRGTGRSEPGLCPDLNGRLLKANIAVAAQPTNEALARRKAAYMACQDESIAHGIDLGDFGTEVTAQDFEWVRRALGVKRWNLYGESYGTTVAMTLTAMHPDTVRSAVLDSIYPPEPTPLWSSIVAGARDAFFASCARDGACSSAFPDLANSYRQALERLGKNPLSVIVPPQLRRPENRVELTASLFEALIANLIYYPSFYPNLPRLIERVRDGDGDGLGAVLAAVMVGRAAGSIGTNAAVECRDRAHYRDRLSEGASVLDLMLLYGICDTWSPLGPAPVVPADTDVPTLVLAGEFDPVAGPDLSRQVAQLIGRNSHWVEVALAGHNVRAFSPCGAKIAAGFIDQPMLKPDISCADRTAPIGFLPK